MPHCLDSDVTATDDLAQCVGLVVPTVSPALRPLVVVGLPVVLVVVLMALAMVSVLAAAALSHL